MTELLIRRLGHQADGIADGPVFVPGALPGELVEGIVDGDTMRDARIVSPSSDRVKPPCAHARTCGGCQVQHASDAFVSEWKAQIVVDALRAQGIETPLRAVFTSPPGSRRRAGFAARRTKKGAMAGFYQKRSDILTEVPGCKVVDPALLAALPLACDLAQAGTSRKASVSVMVTLSEAGLDVLVTGGKPLDPQLEMTLAGLAQKYDLARLSWSDDLTLTRRKPVQTFGKVRVVPPPGAFLQATPQGEAALVRAVTEAVGSAARIADLFAGCGTFALPLASQAQVHAVEGAEDHVQALDDAWRNASGLRQVTTEARDLFRRPLMSDELKYDAIVLDPPRAGAERQVEQIARSDVPVIAYVSCNPISFARDAAILINAGFTLDWLEVIDQFRWSSHVEVASRFSRTDT